MPRKPKPKLAKVLAFKLPAGVFEQPAIEGIDAPSMYLCCGKTYKTTRSLLTHRRAVHRG